MHNCRLTGKNGELIWICSRCFQCYICRHEALWDGCAWVWRCADNEIRPVIFDGRLKEAV